MYPHDLIPSRVDHLDRHALMFAGREGQGNLYWFSLNWAQAQFG
jgi:hypothetical protein